MRAPFPQTREAPSNSSLTGRQSAARPGRGPRSTPEFLFAQWLALAVKGFVDYRRGCLSRATFENTYAISNLILAYILPVCLLRQVLDISPAAGARRPVT